MPDTPWIKPKFEFTYDLDWVLAPVVAAEQGEGPFSESIELSIIEAVDLLAKQIVDRTPVNFGHLSGAISQSKKVWYGDQVWYGEVSDGGMQYAEPVEFGYPPFPGGKGPSKKMVQAIELWIVRKQIQWNKGSKPMTANQMAWALSWYLARHGNEGVHMFEDGAKAAKPHIDKVWANLMKELGDLWASGQGAL